ncbi:MAG: DNA methylase [Oscillospiraceae bacterium]|nr:DNA methylase [Oscillospiraceae bacterium]
MKEKQYIAIDLKSFYASVECLQRGLDPLTTNLVVADPSRTEKTICLAVTPSLKSFGVSGRARLFEVVERVRQVNTQRKANAPGKMLTGSSWDFNALKQDLSLAVDYIIAPPQMALYMETSTAIYNIYLKYVAPEDIHVYSIDEVFIDATPYLRTYGLTAREFAQKLILEVLQTYGVTATAGIGTNLYLCKIAMDIVAKHIPADEHGVRIAELDEMRYRHELWDHRPLTDFWRVGRGYARKLEQHGLFTMGDIARQSLRNEDMLYKLFGINAELLIDHAWGYEPCTIADIKAYRPESNSLSSGQVLHCPYTAEKAKLVIREMADLLALDLVDKGLVTDQIVLTIGYDIENLTDDNRRKAYKGPVTTDHYGRKVPKHAHGTENLRKHTSSTKEILQAVSALFDRIVDEHLLIRRMNITANHVLREQDAPSLPDTQQLSLFIDQQKQAEEAAQQQREKRRQKAVLTIKKKFGKNAILKGMNFEEGATAKDRNAQIGGHKA